MLQHQLVGTFADKYHPEVLSAVRKDLKRVQDQRKILIIDDPADIKEHRNVLRQVIAGRHFFDSFAVHPAFGKVHAVVHHTVIPLKTKCLQRLSRAVADRPYFIAGFNITDHSFDSLFSDQVDLGSPADVDVILRVIGEDDRRAGHLSHKSCHHQRGRRSVRVNDIGLELGQLRYGLSHQRVAGPVSVCLRRSVKTRIGHNLIRIVIIFPVWILGGADFDLRVVIAHHIVGIVHHYIYDAVNDRRKRLI